LEINTESSKSSKPRLG